MKSIPTVNFLVASTLFLSVVARVSSAEPPEHLEPEDGARFFVGSPTYLWDGGAPPRPDSMFDYRIQIAEDSSFERIVDEDQLAAVISWYVPDTVLSPGQYYWRVQAESQDNLEKGDWSSIRRFSIEEPHEYRVEAGSDYETIQGVFQEAAAHTPSRIIFEPGTYSIQPDGPMPFFSFVDVEDLEIDGGGAEIILPPTAPVLAMENCRRMLIRNFTFDYDPLPYTAGRVLSVDLDEGRLEMEILPDHPLPDEFPAFAHEHKGFLIQPLVRNGSEPLITSKGFLIQPLVRNGSEPLITSKGFLIQPFVRNSSEPLITSKGVLVDASESYAMKRDAPLLLIHDGFERLEDRRFFVRFNDPQTLRWFEPGDIYILDPRWYGASGGSTVRTLGGQDIVLMDLTIRAAANECLNSFYTDRLAYIRVRLEREPNRVLSVNNGGNNHHNARTGPWIEGCRFENTGDDVCHVNGYAMGVESQPAPDVVRINFNQPYDQYDVQAELDIRPGDRLQFFNREEGRILAERNVLNVDIDETNKQLGITLDGPVEGLVTGRLGRAPIPNRTVLSDASVTQVFNASRGCNQFVFRGNTSIDSRRVGVLAKGYCGLIENNRFENLGGGGVEFWNAPFEGLGAESYVVRNNEIVNCRRMLRHDASIWAETFRPGADPVHRDILIEGNLIVDPDIEGAIRLDGAQNVLLRNNRILSELPSEIE